MSIALTWFPRAWISIEYGNTTISIDPSFIKTNFLHYKATTRFSPQEDDILPEGMKKSDIILITHAHKDHCKRATLHRLLKDQTAIFAPKQCNDEIAIDFNVVAPEGEFEAHDITVKTIPAYNTSEGSSTRKVHKKGAGVGYVLTCGKIRIYHAGDTDFIPEMSALRDIDVAFLPIGGTFTMDISEAVQAAFTIKPKVVIPIHHLKANPMDFVDMLQNNPWGIKAQSLSMGETFNFD